MGAAVGGPDNSRGMADSRDYIVCRVRWSGSKQGSPSFLPPPALLGGTVKREKEKGGGGYEAPPVAREGHALIRVVCQSQRESVSLCDGAID